MNFTIRLSGKFPILLILALIVTINVFSQENGILRINTKVLKTDTIRPMINGGFIEFLLNYVNGSTGMWAQELIDRGLDNGLCGSDNWLCNWEKYKENGQSSLNNCRINDGGYNKNGNYYVQLSSPDSKKYGILQHIFISDTTPHDFYIYAKSNLKIDTLTIAYLSNGKTTVLYSNSIIVNSSNWKKYSIKLPAIPNVYSCNISVLYSGSGLMDIDELSLMPSNNVLGMRSEYARHFKMWKPGNLRYPGGCFADSKLARWDNCLFPIDQRYSPNRSYTGDLQRLDFGFDEYMKICEYFQIEPSLVVNFEHGTPEEAAAWIEYCNGDVHTVNGKLRANNGHPKPYNVKYWEIGNEQWAAPLEYAKQYLVFYNAMKATDKSIRIIINGNCWDKKSFSDLIGVVGDKCDIFGYHPAKVMFSDHPGSDRNKYLAILGDDKLEEHVFYDYQSQILESPNPKILQGPTEWWTHYGTGGDWLLDSNVRNRSMESALVNALTEMEFYRNPDLIEIASRTIGIGLFNDGFNKKGEKVLYVSPNLYSLAMLRNHIGKYVAETKIEAGMYQVDTDGLWIYETKWLEAMSTVNDDTLFVAVINRHPEEILHTSIIINDSLFSGVKALSYSLKSNHYLDFNSPDEPEKIFPIQNTENFNGSFNFPPHSFTILSIPISGFVFPTNNNDEISLFPNPCFETVLLSKKNSIPEECSIDIFNSIGCVVKKIDATLSPAPILINLRELGTGAYFLRIKSKNNEYQKILIKN